MKKSAYLLLSLIFVMLTVLGACSHEHTFSEMWSADETFHWQAATCQHSDLISNRARHSFEEGFCSVCGAEDPEYSDHEHTFASVWSSDETYHWHEANCGHDLIKDHAEHVFINGYCVECNAESPNQGHTHTFESEWTVDSTYHWHAATCQHTGETSDKAEHIFESGKCIVCNVEDPNANPEHQHTYSDTWSIDETYHWHAATCGHDLIKDKGEHDYKDGKCAVCQVKDPNADKEHTHTFNDDWSSDRTHHWHSSNCEHVVVADKAEHEFVNGKCTVCNYADPSFVEHQHSFSSEWSCNDTNHWRVAVCGHTDLVKDFGEHIFVNGICSVCQAVQPTPPDDYPYEFGDQVSINNDAFYKDYSEQEKQLYYNLWSENTTISIKIDIEPQELAKISEACKDYFNGNSFKADTYRKCNLTITVNGTDYYYEEVGIRMRGNTSRREFANSKGSIYAFVHFRFSLSETFDGEEYEDSWASELYHDWSNDANGRKERKDRSFATMEKFYYKWNKNYDQTYIREIYANRMFQAYGILAPHITLTQLSLKQNGQMESLGVGNLYETIDKQFIKRNFDKANKGGDLYKCTYTTGPADLTELRGGLYGVETPTQRFTYALKTNDDRSAPDYNHNKYLRALIEVLSQSKNSGDFKSKLESMVDMDYFARYEAVNYLLGNPDCIRNNSNNYYIYFTPTADEYESRAILIPYDYDRCLGANMDWNPQESMVYATPFATSGWAGDCKNPLYTKTILNNGLAEYKAMYRDSLQLVLDGKWFTYDHYQQLYLAYKANYSSLAMPSDTIISLCKKNVNTKLFVFSESGASDPKSGDNLAVSVYMTLKRATAIKYL